MVDGVRILVYNVDEKCIIPICNIGRIDDR
jgi:hypothetical protein